ncbi:helix-turn-helix domain-containing protein [Streptosporangium sp. NPDC049078]
MKPEEVAPMLGVSPKTVVTWARTGRIAATRTPGGQWRVPDTEVKALLSA